ncbi:hypothetical protein H6A66_14625 [Bacteroides caecigallinarum]|uniref:hypothetical protein n=1 Tax=Bacteroides caecigallinarum TaxID=1411144 RepID=UPI001958A89F|nr:hypothetical protein [Bacteroides caecigallinarum]MBM6866392.1 hypothetical protein [Bacteroides caecigallinarum]
MNRERRKRIMQLSEKLSEVRTSLESICEEEEDAFDNMPESLQESERGEQMQEYIETMEEAISNIEEIESNLEEIYNV